MAKFKKLRLRVTEKQRYIVGKHKNAPTRIREYINSLQGEEDARRTQDYTVIITDSQYNKLKNVKNKSELVRRFIENTLSKELKNTKE